MNNSLRGSYKISFACVGRTRYARDFIQRLQVGQVERLARLTIDELQSRHILQETASSEQCVGDAAHFMILAPPAQSQIVSVVN